MIIKEWGCINFYVPNAKGERGSLSITSFEPDIIDPLISIFLLLSLVIDQNNKSNYIHISRSSDNRRHNGECICDKIHLSPLLCHIMAYTMRNGKFLWCFYIFFLLYCDILNVIQQQQKLIFQMPIKMWFLSDVPALDDGETGKEKDAWEKSSFLLQD